MACLDGVTRLQSISPSTVLADEALLAIFRQFFKRGTLSECCELLIVAGFGAEDLMKCVQDLQTPPLNAHVVAKQHQPHIADTTPHNTAPHNADNYFRGKFKDSQEYRIRRLLRIADPVANSKISQTLCELSTRETSRTRDPMTQATAMYQRVRESSDRKFPLYFADAVERWALAASSEPIADTTKKSIAFDKMKEQLKVDRKDIVNMYKLGKKYLTCMEVGGAAFLYLMDCTRADFIELNADEIRALYEYRKKKMEIAEAESEHGNTNNTEKTATEEEDNVNIANSLFKDLRVLGFQLAEIAEGDTRLTRLICKTLKIKPKPYEPICRKRVNGNEQLCSDQTVVRSSDQCSTIATSTKNSAVFHLEDPSVSAEKPKKRKKSNRDGHSRPITSNTKASTSSKTSVLEPWHDGGTTPSEGQHFSADIPSHLEQRTGITSCLEEGRNMQHGDIMGLDNVVDSYETPREADIREGQRTENGAEHSQTPVTIADSIVTYNHDSPAPQPSGLGRPQHSRLPSLPSPTSPDVIGSSAIVFVGVSGEETTLAGSTRQTLPPRATSNWQNVVLEANDKSPVLSVEVEEAEGSISGLDDTPSLSHTSYIWDIAPTLNDEMRLALGIPNEASFL